MKIAYFDCPSGVSGNMVLGAFINAGLPLSYLKSELSKLPVTRYSLLVTKNHLQVITREEQTHRHLKDILKIINRSKLSKPVKALSKKIFRALGEAEAKVHGISINKVHFHEIGAVDTIVDIVGSAIGLSYFGIEEVYCSPINTGEGWAKTAHGRLPIPAPAAAELLKGIPIFSSGVKKELTTPTGAAIIKTIAKSFGPLPKIKATAIGTGAGSYKFKEHPNLLRIFIGEKELQTENDAVLQIEANLDDMDPKYYDRAIAALMKAGALDAYLTPIRMKKERNAVNFVVLCRPEDKDRLLDLVYSKTTTMGARVFLVGREKLKKKLIRTKHGRVKIGRLDGKVKTIAPEPDDFKKYKLPASIQSFLANIGNYQNHRRYTHMPHKAKRSRF
jgi:pyridinium-3,5-bisthiocarboxylic acid mononucleotide nickel chelatase